MKILITGAGGQLGRDLLRVLGKSHDCLGLSRRQLDVSDKWAVRERIRAEKPDAIVHAAAYTQVDDAESQEEEAYRINAFGALYVALAAEDAGSKLVYISTDYVFDGAKGQPYDERDRANPLSVYGKSKLLGERLVQETCTKHYIVRTSWLYGKYGDNFITKLLMLSDTEFPVVNDRFGSPTYTYDLAECIGHLIETDRHGTYHAANRGYCSRWQLAKAVLDIVRRDDVHIVPVRSDRIVLPAARPACSALADRALRMNGLPRMRDWKTALEAFLLKDLQVGVRQEQRE